MSLTVHGSALSRPSGAAVLLEDSFIARVRRGDALPAPRAPGRTADARTRLLAAILHLLETRDPDFLTVDVMVRAAQLSRTTFYRLFEDREGALHAAADRMLVDAMANLPRLDEPLGDAEPARLRTWVAGLLDELMRRSRAWQTRDERWRRLVVADLETYISRLREARLVRCDAPRTLATGLVYVLDGALAFATHANRDAPDAGARATVADVAERLVFGA